jgi:peptide chain release factor subunit 1
MLNEINQRELLDFSASEPVLSVYINTDPSAGNADAYRLRLRTMLKEVNLPQDVAAVEGYLNQEYNWSGRGVAIFSCAPQEFFRAYPLGVPVSDRVFIGDRPSVKPLADLLDSYGGYGVVLVDKQGARVFSFHLGQLCEQEGMLGEAIKHTKHGGASSRPGQRGGIAGQAHSDDEVVGRNMKESAEFTLHFFEEKHIRRILIGGTEDNVAMFRALLPKAWQSLIVGSFPMAMTASHADVLSKAIQVGMGAARQREDLMVNGLITAAAKGEAGVVGMSDTLAAVQDGRVQTLVISEGFHEPAYRCKNCSRLSTEVVARCAVCEGEIEKIPDGVEYLVSTVMRAGGGVQVVHLNPVLEQAGHIGALLRY